VEAEGAISGAVELARKIDRRQKNHPMCGFSQEFP